jgi:hypothetical protein
MIIQHGRQWRVVEPTGAMSNFPGYGAPVTLASDAMMRMSGWTLVGGRLPAPWMTGVEIGTDPAAGRVHELRESVLTVVHFARRRATGRHWAPREAEDQRGA